MCRRCGEPDKRGSNVARRRRKRWLLSTFGDGTTCLCVHCEVELTTETVESDRIVPGGSYRHENIQPACGLCNKRRHYEEAGCKR